MLHCIKNWKLLTGDEYMLLSLQSSVALMLVVLTFAPPVVEVLSGALNDAVAAAVGAVEIEAVDEGEDFGLL